MVARQSPKLVGLGSSPNGRAKGAHSETFV